MTQATELVVSSAYLSKLKRLWTWSFGFYGLQIQNDHVNFDGFFRKIVVFFYCIINGAIVLHYLSAIGYNSIYGKDIGSSSFLFPLLVNSSLAGSTIYNFHFKRRKVNVLLNKLTRFLEDRDERAKKTWKLAVGEIIFTQLLLMAMFSTSTAEFLLAEEPTSSFFVKLYYMGVKVPKEKHSFALTLIVIEFLILTVASMTFVNIGFAFFAYTCNVLSAGFEKFNLEIEEHLRKSHLYDYSNLNYFRFKHQYLCQLTNEVSRLFSPILALGILGLIITVCFDLRALKGSQSPYILACFICGAIRHSYLLFLLFKDAAEVHKQAHKLGDKIVTMPINEQKNEKNLIALKLAYNTNFLLFSTRLVDTDVGISASGLFRLTNSSFLSMCGTVLTYVIVLYQTKDSAD